MIDLNDADLERYRKHAGEQTNEKWVGGIRRQRTDPRGDDQANTDFWKDYDQVRGAQLQ